MAAKKTKKALKAKQEAKKPAYSIKNYMEDVVLKNIDEQCAKRNDVCKCDRCRLDTYAFSLNHLPAIYVVTEKGAIYTKLKEMEFQFAADVTREVFKAIEFVKANKRHI
jgi:competence protein ComFB